jgi:CheY-like chemotaxis protein
MIRVMLAEDQAMVRGALSALLSREKDIEVVAEVARGDEVVTTALATLPDIALLDIEMPGGDGLTAARALQQAVPGCRSVILTTFGRSGYLRRAMESGAVGFLLKDAPASELAIALRRVMGGERVVDPDLALSALVCRTDQSFVARGHSIASRPGVCGGNPGIWVALLAACPPLESAAEPLARASPASRAERRQKEDQRQSRSAA